MQQFCCCLSSRTDKVSPGESFDVRISEIVTVSDGIFKVGVHISVPSIFFPQHSKSPSPSSDESVNIFRADRHCTDIMFIALKAAFILILVSAPKRLIAGTGTTSITGGSLKSVGELVIFFHSDWKLVMYILVGICRVQERRS